MESFEEVGKRMKCPKCSAQMLKTEFEQLSGEEIWESWQCPACGYRKEVKRSTPVGFTKTV